MIIDTKIKFLTWSIRSGMLGKYMIQDGLDVGTIYRGSESLVLNVVRLIWFKLRLPFRSIWYANKNANNQGVLVLFEDMVSEDYLAWLVNHNRESRVIFCYWNPIALSRISVETVRKSGCEAWSYSYEDCKKYGMRHVSPLLCESIYRGIEKRTDRMLYDVVFAGKDKGRLGLIQELMDKEYWKSLTWGLYVSPDHFWQIGKKKVYKKLLTYNEIMRFQVTGCAVLELMPSPSNETTMRTFDAIYFRQKLITNNVNIVNREFYNKNNVFVIGIDKDENIIDFLRTPYEELPDEVLGGFKAEKWSYQFMDKEQNSVGKS